LITQRCVLILVIGFFHAIPFTGGNEENQVESNCLNTFPCMRFLLLGVLEGQAPRAF
jgi:hypothetical protein